MSRVKVLVVDDDQIALTVARERLERMGYDVATRGEALGTSQWISENSPDFVLLDVMMPALSGFDLAQFLRRRGLNTVVILHSSKEAAELNSLVRSSGAAGGIQKGIDDDAFTRQFQRLASARC
jgi:CheY-like chemotaxis protein